MILTLCDKHLEIRVIFSMFLCLALQKKMITFSTKVVLVLKDLVLV